MRRGSLLLEVMVAIGVFAAAGLAILALMRDGVRESRVRRDQLRAMDLARSAIAQIESGIASPETLDGMVAVWREESAEGFDDSPPAASGWTLDVKTEASGFSGLTMVTVAAKRERGPTVRLRQLVRLERGAAGGVP